MSSRGIDDNDEDEKEQFTTGIRQVTIEIETNTELDHQVTRIRKYRTELMTNLTEVPITNVITLKIVHPNLFFKGLMKTKIFIQQVDNKITDVIGTLNKRQIRYTTFLLKRTVIE